ncbi:tRNA (adenine(22)-N(1))-methyltransferase [Ruminiclostridium hungatei]|uniref:tRNA (Adenine(22)-N(1))-methyltransferase n=1 Tax=Ruminiclostridium hungatei TaxID=48256 RepID=A0A1V4SI64_RUMHU|nr:class I SAM-dependent methyltransferase [Ruminiclostridium hungatei]OPX43155.1 tRNA (adenine(22)-N(1))-methyltransferase [Ruminiclostridium hungatei]
MGLELKGRLKLISDKVPQCGTVADIGTDHAYIPVYLVQQERCRRAVASDVRPGPVRVADRNISKYRLSHRIETRLGSGLETLEESEADAIIIAGMGGTLLAGLLEAGAEKIGGRAVLVLQPMNDLDIVRKWLYDHKFDIYDEELAAEGNKIYCVMAAGYTGQNKNYEDFQLHVGECLIKKRDPLLVPYCEMKIRQLERVLAQLARMEDNERLRDFHERLKGEYTRLVGLLKP